MNHEVSLLTMLKSPRQTIDRVIHTDPHQGVVLLSIAEGITVALRSSVIHGLHPLPDFIGYLPLLDKIIRVGIGETPSLPLLVSSIFVYGSVLGILLNMIGAILLRFVGILFGVGFKHRGHRTAIAWSFYPYLIIFPLWLAYAFFNYQTISTYGFNYGAIFPLHLDTIPAILLSFDYLLRLISLGYLVVSTSVVQNTTIVRAALIVCLAFFPIFGYFIVTQSFGF